MRTRITKRAVDAMRPGQKDVFHWDPELKGFGVKVSPTGRRVFVLKFSPKTVHNASRRLTIGAYGPFTVDHAREEARRLLGRVAAGENPASERVETRRSLKEATVAVLSAEFLHEARAKMAARTGAEYDRLFRVYIVPVIGKQPVGTLSTRDVAQLHMRYADRPIQANRVLQLLKSFLYWCERRGLRDANTNPCRGIEAFPETMRERFLNVAELAKLGDALKAAETKGLPPAPEHRKKPRSLATAKHRPKNAGIPIPANPYAVAAIRFLLFTGWREQEALTLKWGEVDVARGLATLPRTKTGKSIRPLGAAALELLDSLPRRDGSPFVFPGNKADAPLREIKRVWCAVRHAAGLSDVRLHDLRHTVASFAVGSGHSLYLTGSLLGHARSETTQRYAHLAGDSRRAMADTVSHAMRAALDSTSISILPLRRKRSNR